MIICHPCHPSHLCQDPDSISRTFLEQFVLCSWQKKYSQRHALFSLVKICIDRHIYGFTLACSLRFLRPTYHVFVLCGLFFLNSLPSYLSGDKSLHRAIFGPNFINFRRVPTVIFLFFFKSDNDFDKLISLTSALKTNCNMAILAILNFTYLSQSHTSKIEIQRNINTLFWVYLQSFTIMLSTGIPQQCRTKSLNQQRERSYVSPSLAQAPLQLVDCRTQLICTWIFICSIEKLKEHSREIRSSRLFKGWNKRNLQILNFVTPPHHVNRAALSRVKAKGEKSYYFT